MKKTLSLLAFASAFPLQAHALEVSLGNIKNGGPIPASFAFCKPDGKGKTQDGGNLNPQIRWSDVPKGTQSFALIVVDPDVPTVFDNANKEGKTLPKDMPRQDFYHWVLTDIPANITSIKQGQNSTGHTVGGKPVGQTSYGINGQNDYVKHMKGTFGGYDGPCPPWNDERLHHYHFRVYALNVASLGLKDKFTGKQAMEQIRGHTIAMGEAVGTYTNKK